MADVIPGADGEFFDFQSNLLDWLATNSASVGLTSADLAPADAKRLNYESARSALVPAQAAAQSARALRDTTRADLVAELRSLIRRIQASPLTSDADREAMHLNVPSTAQTASLDDSKPVAELEKVDGLVHHVRLTNSETGKKARPHGATGIEVRMKVLAHDEPVPATPEALPMIGVSTASKWEQPFTDADACKRAAWGFRYIGSNGQKGPWSTVVSGTIAA